MSPTIRPCWASSDHGEAFGELGVYADHQAADEATCHIPAVLRWPGVAARSTRASSTTSTWPPPCSLAGFASPGVGRPARSISPEALGRDHLVLSQGAWSCQRGVRFGDHLYLRTWHDGYHGHWADEMLFDVARTRTRRRTSGVRWTGLPAGRTCWRRGRRHSSSAPGSGPPGRRPERRRSLPRARSPRPRMSGGSAPRDVTGGPGSCSTGTRTSCSSGSAPVASRPPVRAARGRRSRPRTVGFRTTSGG